MAESVAFRRSFALLYGEWPSRFSTMYASNLNMDVGSHSRVLTVSYLDYDLTERQRREIRTFMINRPPSQVYEWIASVIERLHTNQLTPEWLKSQDFNKDLEFICGVKIICIFNFPCDEPIIKPTDRYPLAVVFSGL